MSKHKYFVNEAISKKKPKHRDLKKEDQLWAKAESIALNYQQSLLEKKKQQSNDEMGK